MEVNLKIATIEFETRESLLHLHYNIIFILVNRKAHKKVEFKILYVINVYIYIGGRKNSEWDIPIQTLK